MALNLNNLPINDRGEVWSGGQMVGMMPGGGGGGASREQIAQSVMAQQGMPPPQGPMMGGAPPQGGYALGTFQGGPDPNAPGSMVGQPDASNLYNSSEDRGSYDPAGYGEFGPTGMNSPVGAVNPFSEGAATGRFGFGETGNQPFGGRGGGREGFGNAISVSQTAPSMPSGMIPGSAGILPSGGFSPAAYSPIADVPLGNPPAGVPSQFASPLPGYPTTPVTTAPLGPLAQPGLPSTSRGHPVGSFQGGPDPNAPASSGFNTGGIDFGAPGGFPGGYGGFGAFGGFSPGMGSGGWGGGFEGSGFNSGGDYSGGYDTAAGTVG